MGFGVGDSKFDDGECVGFSVCQGDSRASCETFPCPPADGVYAVYWNDNCGSLPGGACVLSYYTGTEWKQVTSHTPNSYRGYVWVRFGMGSGSCGWAYKITFGGEERRFLIGTVKASRIPCDMWSAEMIKEEKDKLREEIRAEKADATADVREYREAAKVEVALIRGKAKVDIAAERAEYKLISGGVRDRVKRELVDIRDLHNAHEATLKATYATAKALSDDEEKQEKLDIRAFSRASLVSVRDLHNEHEATLKTTYKTAKTLSDDEERQEKVDARAVGKVDISDEKHKETDDIGNIRIQRDLDVAKEYGSRDSDIEGRYTERDRKVEAIKASGLPCVIV